MKKSIFLASLLFSVSSFAETSIEGCSFGVSSEGGGCSPNNVSQGICTPSTITPTAELDLGKHIDYGTVVYSSTYRGTGMDSNYFYFRKIYGLSCPACPSGSTRDPVSYTCLAPPLSAYNNDPEACHDHDGLLKADGTCVTYSDFGAYLLSEPTAMIGAGLFINGYFYTAAGLVGGTLFGGAALAGAGFATVGGIAMAAGIGTALYGAADDIAANFTQSPSNDMYVSSTQERVKVNLDQYNNTTVATADTQTGKVKEISYIPNEVKQRILEGVVNPTTGLPNITPSQLAGTTSTKYDYSTNTATTSTYKSDGTVQTSTTPFTPLKNPDGTVTAQSHSESIAPTVTGTKSTPTEVPNWNQYQTIAQWIETANTTGGTGGTGTSGGGAGATPINTGDSTADALLNADMPSYSLGENGTFNHTDESHINTMFENTNDFIGNIQSQIDSVKTVYDQTESMLKDGIAAPNIPTGQCSNGLQLDIWGKHIDLCPAITEFITPYSNLIALLITLAGLVFAISIFLGGM